MVAVPVQWWVAKQLLARARHAPGTAVAEEGLVQALWTAGLVSRAADVPQLVGLAESTARPDLVVHLDTPFELTLERLRSRESRHSRVQALGDAQQRAAMKSGDTLLRSLLAEWTRRGYGDVVVVNPDATDPVDRIATMLTRSADGTPAPHSGQGDG
jgi:cytidylate kinase